VTILSEGILHHQIIPLLGCPGTGKTFLLQYLVREHWTRERELAEGPRIVYIELRSTTAKAGGRFSTPMACIAFTEMTFGLAEISRRYDSEFVHNTRIWYRQPQGEYSDRQFNSLFAFVRDEFRRLGIDGLLVDNASLLDITTMQRILDLRRLLRHRLALIFSTQIEREGTINDSLARVLDVTINKKKEAGTADISEVERHVELKPTSQAETSGPVLKGILRDLNVDFAPDLKLEDVAAMRAMFWKETLGTWDMIAKLERRLRGLVQPGNARRTFLTKELIEQWFGKPLSIETKDG
jgi:hypothetical protein